MQCKIIRKFKDKDNTVYTIYKKLNNHVFLVINKQNKRVGQMIEGSKSYITNYLIEKINIKELNPVDIELTEYEKDFWIDMF